MMNLLARTVRLLGGVSSGVALGQVEKRKTEEKDEVYFSGKDQRAAKNLQDENEYILGTRMPAETKSGNR